MAGVTSGTHAGQKALDNIKSATTNSSGQSSSVPAGTARDLVGLDR